MSDRYIYEFGDFRLDPAEQLLLHKGGPVPLTPKVFETLLVLVQSQGRLIEKEDFIRRLWPGVFVEEVALAQNISQLRKALGDGKNGSRIIQTVHKRGYRFTPAVREIAGSDPKPVAAVSNGQADEVPLLIPSTDPGAASTNDGQLQGATDSEIVPVGVAPATTPSLEERPQRNWGLFLAAFALVPGLVLAVLFAINMERRHGQSSGTAPGPSAHTRFSPVLNVQGKVSDPTLSPNAQQVAFVWDEENLAHGDVYVHLIGGEKPLRLTHTTSGFTCCASWSPDMRQVAFGRCDDSGGAVFVVSALGGTERKITSVACRYGNAGWPVWTADGKSMVIADRCSAEGAIGIVLFSLATGHRRCLTQPDPGDRGDQSPVLSPDGSTIAFIRLHSRTVNEICTVPVQGGTTRVVTSDGGSFWGLMWSSDGRRLIFRSPRQGINRIWNVFRDGGPVSAETVYPEVGSQSRDGSRLAYHENPGHWPTEAMRITLSHPGGPVLETRTLFASGSTSSALQPSPDDHDLVFESDLARDAGWTMEIWKSRSDGSDPLQLTRFNGHAGTPRWSPDGKSIAFDYRPGLRSHIYVMDSEGRNPHLVTSDQFEQQVPSWSRDGRSIYFTANNTGDWEVWRRNLASGEERQITHRGGYAAFESHDGKRLFYSKFDGDGIWTVPTAGGSEERITEALHHGYWGHFAVVESGLYFLDADAKPRPAILFYDVHSRRVTPVLTLDKVPLPWTASLAASRDGRRIYFTQYKLTGSIALAENFQ
jgi:Tol biopolymer transport system component/DNA-binding winged helix-turn-helix (wHTH) protein